MELRLLPVVRRRTLLVPYQIIDGGHVHIVNLG
jgi:hypothetical protein